MARTALAVVAALLAAAVGTVASLGSPAGAAVQTGPFTIDVSNREDVRQSWNLLHEATADIPTGWTGGSIATCTPGTVSQEFLDGTLSRTNWFRAMAGVPPVTYSAANNATAQAGALMEAANPPNGVGHVPPQAGTNCWSPQAFDGAARSNLAWGGTVGVHNVDGLVYDGNALGHRRNFFDPSISVMGAGAVPNTPTTPTPFFTQMVLTTPSATRPPVRSGFVAWPPDGFVPYQVVPARWSFSLPNTDFSSASVTMQRNGASVPVQIRCVDPNVTNDPNCGQSAESAIVWTANNMLDNAAWPKPASDQAFTVTITNAKVAGVAQNFTYRVTVIDPATSDLGHTLSQAPQGPARPTVNQNPGYTAAAVADASGYQWRTSTLTPGNVFDDAEKGIGDWTPTIVGGYDPVSTARASTGTSSFRLAAGSVVSGSPPEQVLTLKKTLLASATSQLTFDALYHWVNSEAATVEVSTDSGANWVPAFEEHPIGQFTSAAFNPKVVSLGQFAGRLIQIRFRLAFDKSGGWSNCCTEPGGWYFDNVSITGVQTAGAPTLSPVGANPAFTLQNPQAGTVALDVRPRFTNATFGSAFGGWSPAKLVTSVVPSASATALTSSANPSDGNQEVTYTATVNPTSGDGAVRFTENGITIPGCAAVSLTAGKATCKQTYFFGADRAIVATYTGDSAFTDSTSPTLQQVVTAPAPVTGSLVTSDDHVDGGEPVTFTATVTPTDGGGTISFTDNNVTILGCGALPLTAAGQATCTMVSQGPEHALIEATYSGDANFLGTSLGSLLQNVTAATSTAITSSANPSSAGQAVTYTATLTPVTTQGTISFTDNGDAVGTCQFLEPDNSGQATCTVTYGSGGPHAVQAAYSGWGGLSSYAPSTSPVLGQSVTALAASSTTLSSSANPTITGAQTTYTAIVDAPNLGGSVLFTDRGDPIAGCEAVAVNGFGRALCGLTYADVGSHSIVATYSGAPGVAVSSSAPVAQVVNVPTPLSALLLAVSGGLAGAIQAAFDAPPAAPALRASGSAVTDVTGFNVYVGTTPGGQSGTPVNSSRILATAKGFTITGLTNGTRYYVVVRALNRGGLGAKSAELAITAATAPSPPRTPTAYAGNGQANLSWTAPASTGGAAITRYNVYRGTVAGGEAKTPVNPTPLPATARSYTAKGLTNTTRYYFVVRASNVVGVSLPSAEVSATPVGVPNAPTNAVAYAGNASAGLRWSAPNIEQSSITGFNVYKGTSPGGESGTPVNASPLSPSATSYTVNGLANGTTYRFTVKAVNAVGKSAPSNEVAAKPTTAATAPTPPRNLKALAGSKTAKLTWTAPASNGGRPITGYNVYKGPRPDLESATPVNPSPLAATATTYTATGLTNGKPTYFTLKAVNSIGSSVASNEASARPEATSTTPAAPRNLYALAGNGKATLSWAAPAWNGGSAVTGFNVYVGTLTGGESSTPVNASPLGPNATTYNVNGLINGTRYYFVVKAVNAVGKSPASNEESTTPKA
jgi:uncharacterized protein YkwD